MSTVARMFANKTNAQSSTGPRTPEGKQIASQNATTHGLTAGFRVLPQENQQEFDAMMLAYAKEFGPQGQDETFLVERMVENRWELKRCNRLMAEVVARMAAEAGVDPTSADGVIADALIAKTANALTTLKRYAAAAERSYLRCRRDLLHASERRREKDIVSEIANEITMSAHRAAVRNEPTTPPEPTPQTRRATPGVPFTETDPLSWRL